MGVAKGIDRLLGLKALLHKYCRICVGPALVLVHSLEAKIKDGRLS